MKVLWRKKRKKERHYTGCGVHVWYSDFITGSDSLAFMIWFIYWLGYLFGGVLFISTMLMGFAGYSVGLVRFVVMGAGRLYVDVG